MSPRQLLSIYLIRSVVYIYTGVLMYLAGAFIGAEFNPMNWSAESRLLGIVLWFIVGTIGAITTTDALLKVQR